MTSLNVMRVSDYDGGIVLEGEILFHGEDLVKKSQEDMRKTRVQQNCDDLQEAMNALNPVFTVGDQIAEPPACTKACQKENAQRKAVRDTTQGRYS